jgi:hypothetical protein
MGIQVEFDPELALRNFFDFENGTRKKEECIPKNLTKGEVYSFLKSGQRNYWIFGEIPLIETKGNGVLSRPKASVILLEVTHFLKEGKVFTKGNYKVVEVFDDDKIHFEGTDKVGERKF